MPTVSVIFPVYNAAAFLQDSIASVLQQTHADLELLAVNDGSTDGSDDILARFAASDSRIRLINQANRGVSAARNCALEVAQGDFLALLDADDICHPERFKRQLDHMHTHSLDVCGSYMQSFGHKHKLHKYPLHDHQLKHNLFFAGRGLPNPSVMLRRSVVTGLRYQPGVAYAEDYAFWIEAVVFRQAKLGNIPLPLVQYRTHAAQASRKYKGEARTATATILHSALTRYGHTLLTPEILLAHYDFWKEGIPVPAHMLQSYLGLLQAIYATLAATTNYDFLFTRALTVFYKHHSGCANSASALLEHYFPQIHLTWQEKLLLPFVTRRRQLV